MVRSYSEENSRLVIKRPEPCQNPVEATPSPYTGEANTAIGTAHTFELVVGGKVPPHILQQSVKGSKNGEKARQVTYDMEMKLNLRNLTRSQLSRYL
jgi:hypothetical protein